MFCDNIIPLTISPLSEYGVKVSQKCKRNTVGEALYFRCSLDLIGWVQGYLVVQTPAMAQNEVLL